MASVQTPSSVYLSAHASAHPSATAARTRRPRGLVSEIVDALVLSIRQGQLKPGDKLPTEAEFMARFEVSRTVVREAISKLQASGLVETRHGIGTFVIEPPDTRNFKIAPEDFATVADVIALLELRISLKPSLPGWPPSGARLPTWRNWRRR